MKVIKFIMLLTLIGFFVACGTSDTKSIDQLSESYIQGVEDLGEAEMNGQKIVFDSAGQVDEEATSALKSDAYDLEILTIVNTEQEFEKKIKYFLKPKDIKKFEAIDFTDKTLLFVSSWVPIDAKLPAFAIKTIEDAPNNHIHCVIYKDIRLKKGIRLHSFIMLYHAYLIPKTKKEDITYDVIDITNQ